jgi:hypothetical protein
VTGSTRSLSELDSMVAELLDYEEHLTEWEQSFIDNISVVLAKKRYALSERQLETLDRIWTKVQDKINR